MFKVIADGAGSHRLEDASGQAIGWIDLAGIGMRGFPTEHHAVEAVNEGWHALEVMLRREYAGWRRQAPVVERLHVISVGNTRWITDGHARLAKLHTPSEDGALTSFALEYPLPSFVSEGMRISAAHAVAQALRRTATREAAELRLSPRGEAHSSPDAELSSTSPSLYGGTLAS